MMDELRWRRLHHLLKKAIIQYHLIERNDAILIGLSGGKDSLLLLRALGERMVKSGGYFRVEALHVVRKGDVYVSDVDFLYQEAARFQVPLHVVEIDVETDLKEGRSPCYLCARRRRTALFQFAQSHGFTKIALGHHKDDIIRTALMNLLFNGSFTTMPFRLDMDKFKLSIIRPLGLVDEDLLRDLAQAFNLPKQIKRCPYEEQSNRQSIEEVLHSMKKISPEYKAHLWHALEKSQAL